MVEVQALPDCFRLLAKLIHQHSRFGIVPWHMSIAVYERYDQRGCESIASSLSLLHIR